MQGCGHAAQVMNPPNEAGFFWPFFINGFFALEQGSDANDPARLVGTRSLHIYWANLLLGVGNSGDQSVLPEKILKRN